MTTLLLDAGALIGVERATHATLRVLALAEQSGMELRTHPLVVAQAWRGGSGRQAVLARFLQGVEVASIDHEAGRRAGELLGAAQTSDPVDAALVLLAREGDQILTSDADDLGQLVEAVGLSVSIVPI
jgi:predicted nucleic acid-binding protein